MRRTRGYQWPVDARDSTLQCTVHGRTLLLHWPLYQRTAPVLGLYMYTGLVYREKIFSPRLVVSP